MPTPRFHGGALLVTLGGLSMFGPLSSDMYLPGLPSLTRTLHVSASAGQLTLTASVLGIGLGQLLLGPLSDAHGRRPPLLAGLVCFIVFSLACAVAPSILPLIAFRFVQGLSGAAGIVIGRAVVRDRYSGNEAARAFAVVLTVNGLSPILAPLIGGQILRFTSWRGVFVTLAVIAAVLLAMTARLVPETLAPANRHTGGLAQTLSTFGGLIGDRRFMGPALSYALSFCAMFAYISGSSFVLENIYGISPQAYSAAFATNALGIVALTVTSRRLVGRFGAATLLRAGLLQCLAGTVLTLTVCLAHADVWLLLIGLFTVASSLGLVTTNAITIAMGVRPDAHGSASGLIGLGQFAMGALVAPLVGLGGSHDAVPMGIVMVSTAAAALTIHLLLGRPHPRSSN